MARLDAGESVYQIKKTLEKPEIGPSDGLIIKCKIAKAEHPSVFCLHPGNDSSFVTDEDDDVKKDKEAPLERAQPFGASADSVGVPGESKEQRRDSESLHSDSNEHCNCEHHKPSAGAQRKVSTLQAALDTVMAASAATSSKPFRSAESYQPRADEWSSNDFSPFYRRLSRRRLLHRTAATAGGGDMVSTYIGDDGFEYAIVDSGAAGHFVGD